MQRVVSALTVSFLVACGAAPSPDAGTTDDGGLADADAGADAGSSVLWDAETPQLADGEERVLATADLAWSDGTSLPRGWSFLANGRYGDGGVGITRPSTRPPNGAQTYFLDIAPDPVVSAAHRSVMIPITEASVGGATYTVTFRYGLPAGGEPADFGTDFVWNGAYRLSAELLPAVLPQPGAWTQKTVAVTLPESYGGKQLALFLDVAAQSRDAGTARVYFDHVTLD